ncbi:putative allantoicase [Schizosaccharomyces pombe]|uniref:Probable allantoicase n=1 Tax=Schizosaccharomyces pombe (strain 972 / ATCC 24843) TaxID=284812 RepID=ALLC_SCHPO|nr:putative allantoicase [Schizosaccharomyces pombe]Q09913.1 RecName: Full=Probable allantoicase; AltName: Full=Allantoate amidinohydrolase [Schizosaccharomyces pombe 972h-]CAA91956.1 allantoicase (predicted) [Schizosaccharomyces pombe]|eukprot:NP_594495.1 putative allantoicase [Schizosaccharomyces pombe]
MSVENVERLSPEQADAFFGQSSVDLISRALGGQVLGCSDDFFASCENLINPADPIRKAGVFVETGAWYDGWETRRHNTAPCDWVIVKLGPSSGRVTGCEIDTTFFNGNHAPEVSVEAAFLPEGNPDAKTNWTPILPKLPCGPTQRHIYRFKEIPQQNFTHVRLCMYPDGGIARFRLYGNVVPVFPADLDARLDLAHMYLGGLVVQCSDQHFGKKDNLLLPGRGVNMGDGWETARSREKGHVDWVIVKLGARGYIDDALIDTNHFKGNYPKEVILEAIDSPDHIPGPDAQWVTILPARKLGPHMEHVFTNLQNNSTPMTHVRMIIIPDGGVKRLRIYGRRAAN